MFQLNQLSFSIAGVPLVHPITKIVEPSSVWAIVGESGAGKSTLLHLLAGLESPSTGTLHLREERVKPPSEKLVPGHPEIKLVRQQDGLFPNISIRENIAYELRFFQKEYQRERTEMLLHLSGLQAIGHRLPREVSGGEQQRASIVKAMADTPDVLLLDEPFSHLDPLNKRHLQNTLRQFVAEEKIVCIFVTHDVSDAFAWANEISVLQNGCLVQTDSPEVLYRFPANEYVAGLTGIYTLVSPDFQKKYALDSPFLRPEMLLLQAQDGDFYGRVERCVFRGNHYELTVFVEKENLTFLVQSPQKQLEGEKVYMQLLKR
ncbi:MAG: ABC transporter ATP-binding protein [Spirosomataceae bacterium]